MLDAFAVCLNLFSVTVEAAPDENMYRIALQCISGDDRDTILLRKFDYDISRRDVQTLSWFPTFQWLNDQVVNFYMDLLAERSRNNASLPKVHAMKSFFMTCLLQNGYSGVKRWTKKVDIFGMDIILVPVNKRNHWSIAIIHIKERSVMYYNSMGTEDDEIIISLSHYLVDEHMEKRKVPLPGKWIVDNVRNIPLQMNFNDCGVFTCQYAEYITRNQKPIFNQNNMLFFRQMMAYEVCVGQLINK